MTERRRCTSTKFAFVILPLLLLVHLTSVSQQTDPPSDVLLIQTVLDQQVSAWNDGDIERYMQGYWKSDSLLFTSGGNIQKGWQATLEKYRKSYSTRSKMGTLTFGNLEITRLSAESAWVFGHWELRRTGDHPHGVFTLVLRKFEDGWKIIHDHTSSSP